MVVWRRAFWKGWGSSEVGGIGGAAARPTEMMHLEGKVWRGVSGWRGREGAQTELLGLRTRNCKTCWSSNEEPIHTYVFVGNPGVRPLGQCRWNCYWLDS